MADLAQYDPIFKAAGEEWDVDPLILKAMATQESGGNPRARSKANAQGLMQIIPETQKYLGVTDPHDPEQSIYGGAKYLAEALTAERENPTAALLYYHGGPGWRQSYGPESRGYVPAISAHYQRYAKADTGTRTDAAPAPATGGPAVPAAPSAAAKSPAKADEDDPYTAALGGTKASTGTGKASAEPDAPDPYTAALGKPGQEAPQATADGKAQGAEPPGSAKMADWGIPGVPAAAPHPLTPPPEPGVRERIGNMIGDTASRVGNALASGYQAAPGLLTPEAQASLESVPVVGKDLGFLTSAAGAGLKGVGALFSGAQAGVAAAGDPIGEAVTGRPGLGRGLAGMMEVAPEAMRGHPLLPGAVAIVPDAVRAVRDRIADNRLNAAAPLSPEFKASPLTPEMTAKIGAPSEASPLLVGPDGRPVPQSVGSAASREGTPAGMIDMAPADVKANRRQAEMADLHEPAAADDVRIHVKGSFPTKAEYSGNALVSQEETLLRQRSPEAFDRRLSENNAARVADFEDFTPSHTEVRSIERERSIQAQADNEAIIQHAKPADAQPALDYLDGVLSDKRNANRDSVQKNLAPYRARLFDAEGKLKTDAQELWGLRDDLTEKLDKIGSDPQSTMGYVKKETQAFRDAIDDVLNKATGDRYQTFLDNYAKASQKINEGRLLNEFRDKSLTDAKGNINANRFHKFVVDIAHERGERGIHPEMDISDATMARLIALDRDLKRTGQIDLGKARGSPTNLFGTLSKGMGLAGAHAVTALAAPGGIANLALQGAVSHGVPIIGKMRLNYLTNKHLREPEGGYHPLIDLNGPP